MLCQRWILLIAVASVACSAGGGAAPVFDPVGDQVAVVGREFRVELAATDADGDPVAFDFHATLPSFNQSAELRSRPGGSALLAWLPSAQDEGEFSVDLIASDGANQTVETIAVQVRSADQTLPSIVEPRNPGTLFEPTDEIPCLDIDIVVQHHTEVEIVVQGGPEGARLDTTLGRLTAKWRWCPTPAQIDAGGRHSLVIVARDGEVESAPKTFVIMLEPPDGGSVPHAGCVTNAPVIEHMPTDLPAQAIAIKTRILDDKGVKHAFACIGTRSAAPNELCGSTVPMRLSTGTAQDGTWVAEVPSSAIDSAASRLYYFLAANDEDDPAGGCHHRTFNPSNDTPFSVSLTPGGGGGGGPTTGGYCSPCASSKDCPSDMTCLIHLRSDGGHACAHTCSQSGADAECSGTSCSFWGVGTTEGDYVFECLPPGNALHCDVAPKDSSCAKEDTHEPNDDPGSAAAISAGTTQAKLCPDAALEGEDDYYTFTITQSMTVDLQLTGPAPADLDMELRGATFEDRWLSIGSGSTERITRCVSPGRYTVRVWSIMQQPASGTAYQLSYSASPCSCVPDEEEPDNSQDDARLVVNLRDGHRQTGQTICQADSDWYYLGLLASGRTIHATLDFAQSSPVEDLDFELWHLTEDEDLIPLYPCVFPTTECAQSNGQSATSNENFVWPVRELSEYLLVVRGFNGAMNEYDICIGDNATTCPPLFSQ